MDFRADLRLGHSAAVTPSMRNFESALIRWMREVKTVREDSAGSPAEMNPVGIR